MRGKYSGTRRFCVTYRARISEKPVARHGENVSISYRSVPQFHIVSLYHTFHTSNSLNNAAKHHLFRSIYGGDAV